MATRRSFRFHPGAEADLTAAADWYDERREGLGLELVAAVRGKVVEILEAPARWRLVKGTRRAFLSRFPFSIVYRELATGDVEIVAVAHFKRRPRYWSRR